MYLIICTLFCEMTCFHSSYDQIVGPRTAHAFTQAAMLWPGARKVVKLVSICIKKKYIRDLAQNLHK